MRNGMICDVCGCSDFDACVDPDTLEPCAWVAEALCSACIYAPIGLRYPLPYERVPLYAGIELVA